MKPVTIFFTVSVMVFGLCSSGDAYYWPWSSNTNQMIAELTSVFGSPFGLMGVVDSNQDGLISRDEFITVFPQLQTLKGPQMTPQRAASVFATLDSNQDGIVTPIEYFENQGKLNGKK